MAHPNQVLVEWYELECMATNSKKTLDTYVPDKHSSLSRAGNQVRHMISTISRAQGSRRSRSSSACAPLNMGWAKPVSTCPAGQLPPQAFD